MPKADHWKATPADLRRIAMQTREPERERKMLVLAEQLEREQAAQGELTESEREKAPE
jgi:hypothetical protein